MKRETNNSHCVNAVAVYREDVIVGHIPFNLASRLSAFLMRDVNKVFAEVEGAKVTIVIWTQGLVTLTERD